jgi:tryptophan synthase alpha chain
MLSATFDALRSKHEKALVLFITAGDPSLEELPEILDALVEGGADVIELGLPFSDPIADGPTIQASSQRALDLGVTPTAVLAKLGECKVPVPIVLMGYFNPILRKGLPEFARDAKAAGASATIVSDLTPEESDGWLAVSKSNNLDTIFLAAPTSTDERLDAVCSRASGFVYAVSRTGVTGAQSSVPEDVPALVGRLKERTQVPVCVGFGISTPDHVRAVARVADGVVVGSWLVTKLSELWDHGNGRSELVRQIRALKEATKP